MKRALLVPADLHQTAGLVLRDVLREGTVELARSRASAWQAAGDETWVDFGDRGGLAVEVAHQAAAFAADHIGLLVPRTHARSGRVLAQAIEAIGCTPTVTIIEAAPLRSTDEADTAVVPSTPDAEWLSRRTAPVGWVLPCTAPPAVHDRLASPFPPALHPHDDAWLVRITNWLKAHRPHALAEWRCLMHAHDAHVNPVEAIYAGLHLRDRNAELLVNIL